MNRLHDVSPRPGRPRYIKGGVQPDLCSIVIPVVVRLRPAFSASVLIFALMGAMNEKFVHDRS